LVKEISGAANSIHVAMMVRIASKGRADLTSGKMTCQSIPHDPQPSSRGDADHAAPILKRLLQIPYGFAITPPLLRVDPMFDPRRNDPRFQKLAASPAPKN
jgi:hypothetical protein